MLTSSFKFVYFVLRRPVILLRFKLYFNTEPYEKNKKLNNSPSLGCTSLPIFPL